MTQINPAAESRSPPSRGLFAALLPAHAGQAMTISLMAPVVPAIAAHFGGGRDGDFSAQLVAVTPFLGIIVGGVASGWAIRTAGLRNFVLIAASLFATAGCIGLSDPSLSVLLVGCLVLGFAAIFLLSGLSALTSMVYDGAERSKVVGLQAAVAGLCNIVFGLAGAFLAERLGWRVPFGVFFGFGAVVMALTVGFVPSTAQQDAAPPMATGLIISRTWPVLLAGGMTFMMIVSQSTQLPFLMAEKGITSSGLRGVVLTTLAAASMLGSISYGFLQYRVRESRLILCIGVGGVAAWSLFGQWSSGLPVALLAAGLVGACQGVVIPMLFGSVMRAVPGEAAGPAIGLLNVAVCFGSFLNPVLLTPVRAHTGLPGLMFVLAGLTGLITCAALRWPTAGADAGSAPLRKSVLLDSTQTRAAHK